MSMAESTARTGIEFACGKCSHPNLAGVKFCGGCGHSLFEPCPGCGQSVRLTEKFCGACGADLEAALQSRMEKAEQAMVAAVAATKEHRYADAITRLEIVIKDQDFRLAELADQARQALAKIIALRDQMTTRVEAAARAAKVAAANADREEVVRILDSVPVKLLDEDSARLLSKSRSFVCELAELVSTLRGCLSEKNWLLAGSLIERLVELCPEDESFRSLGGQVASKLMIEADRQYSRRDYARAVDCLDAVPATAHDAAYAELRQKIDNVEWLSAQFDAEPYATATLGRLAVRLAKQTPDDPQGKELVNRIATRLKEPIVDRRHPYPVWNGSRRSRLGGDAAILGWPRCVDCRGDAVTQKFPARFSVAIGLAMQGLGGARVNESLWEKKSLLGGIGGRRKARICWGVDIGNSAIHAVLLQKDATNVVVIQAYYVEFPPPTRLGKDSRGPLVIRDAIKTMTDAIDFGSVDVVANYPGREVLVRFVELPPVEDKKAKALLEVEATGQFPIANDELCMIRWFAEKPEQDGYGRPAAIVAARKFAVKNRVDFLVEAGLKVSSLQCEQIALVNFAAVEFEAELQPPAGSNHRVGIALVDAGSAATTLVLMDSIGFWFRTIEGGSEELTMSLARTAKVVADEADRLKKDPSLLASPAKEYAVIEERQQALALRLSQVIGEPLKQSRTLKIEQTWAVGGGAFGHGWIRRVLCGATD